MTITKKLYLGIFAVAAVLVGLAVFFVLSFKTGHDKLEAVKEYPEIQAILGSRTIDHYKWADALAVGTIML